MYPTTIAGKIFGAVCAVTGVVILAMPVGLLASNFSENYKENDYKTKIIEVYKKKRAFLGKLKESNESEEKEKI